MTYSEKANEFFKLLGIKGLKPYSELYGTSDKTFGMKGSSVWFITLKVNEDEDIVGYELNRTYYSFKKNQLLILKEKGIKGNG
jgi:hypothetical protein